MTVNIMHGHAQACHRLVLVMDSAIGQWEHASMGPYFCGVLLWTVKIYHKDR